MSNPLRILVVEADSVGVEEVRADLGRWGTNEFEIVHASSIRDAHETPTDGLDAVVLNLDVPDADGLQAIREVRLLHDKPVVVLQSAEDELMGIAAMQNGAQDVLPKQPGDGALARSLVYAIERHRLSRKAERAAVTDQLTGLPNRALFDDRLHGALTRARRNNSRVALLFIDLDDFKPINDEHGHPIGDLLLKKVARRLTRSIRQADTVARIGGDEFCVVLESVANARTAVKVGRQLRQLVSKPVTVRSRVTDVSFQLEVGCSIGIALFPDHALTAEDLVRYADHAMYESKRAQKGMVTLFDPEGAPWMEASGVAARVVVTPTEEH